MELLPQHTMYVYIELDLMYWSEDLYDIESLGYYLMALGHAGTVNL